jgi:hypothetical protein
MSENRILTTIWPYSIAYVTKTAVTSARELLQVHLPERSNSSQPFDLVGQRDTL